MGEFDYSENELEFEMSDAARGLWTGIGMVVVALVITNFIVLPNNMGAGESFVVIPILLLAAGGVIATFSFLRLLIGAAGKRAE